MTALRYAASDEDVIAIHRFVCFRALPTLPAEADAKSSIDEVYRVVHQECALMAMQGDTLVGTMGIIQPRFWWAKNAHFLVNRWFHALPGLGAGALMLREAIRIAKAAELELHIIDEDKQRYSIFNRHPRRGDPSEPQPSGQSPGG